MRLLILISLLSLNLPFSTLIYARSQFTLPPAQYSLTIKTTPSNAVVRIMNIKPSYHDGIELREGNYRIQVSSKGYHTNKQTVTLRGKDQIRYIVLNKIVTQAPVTKPVTNTVITPHPPASFVTEDSIPSNNIPVFTPPSQANPNRAKHSFNHTKGYNLFLNYSNSLYGVSYNNPKFFPYCKFYSKLAVRQARRRIENHCEKEISLINNDKASQWLMNSDPQEKWCRTVSSHATYNETIYREERLEYCIAGYILRSK